MHVTRQGRPAGATDRPPSGLARLASTRAAEAAPPAPQAAVAVLGLSAARPATRVAGTILVRGLSARCIIGANAWERVRRQRVEVDLELEADLGPAVASDALADAIDYKAVKDEVLAYVRGSRHVLLESLAAGVADLVLRDPRIQCAAVTVAKPGALTGARSVAVRLVRRAGA